ncbi:MAG TPA: O-antigen ligase family protein [Vicinamibacterales bacterium]
MSRIVSRFFARVSPPVAAAELLILILISPALLLPTPARLLVMLVVPVMWLCVRRVSGHIIPPTPLNAALLLLLAMVGVSLLVTFDVRFSLGKVAGVVLGALVFWAVSRRVTTRRRLAAATIGFLICGGVLAVIGLLGTNWFNKFPMFPAVINRLPRTIRGLPGAESGFQPNGVAGCLVLFVPLQVALAAAGAGRRLFAALQLSTRATSALVALQWVLLALTAGTLLLTQSRGAWAGCAIAAAAFLGWHGWRTRAVALAAVLVCVVWAVVVGPQRLLNMAISQSGAGMAGNVSGRVELWSRALYGIADVPLTGMGMNTARKVIPVLYPTFLASPDFDVAHAHNQLLQAALDLGIPGLIAYLALWLICATLLVRVYRRSLERGDRAMAGGLGAGLIAQFSFGMTDSISLGSKPAVLFWFMLALIVSLHRIALPPAAAHYNE